MTQRLEGPFVHAVFFLPSGSLVFQAKPAPPSTERPAGRAIPPAPKETPVNRNAPHRGRQRVGESMTFYFPDGKKDVKIYLLNLNLTMDETFTIACRKLLSGEWKITKAERDAIRSEFNEWRDRKLS